MAEEATEDKRNPQQKAADKAEATLESIQAERTTENPIGRKVYLDKHPKVAAAISRAEAAADAMVGEDGKPVTEKVEEFHRSMNEAISLAKNGLPKLEPKGKQLAKELIDALQAAHDEVDKTPGMEDKKLREALEAAKAAGEAAREAGVAPSEGGQQGPGAGGPRKKKGGGKKKGGQGGQEEEAEEGIGM